MADPRAATYVYAITRHLGPEGVRGLRGVAGEPVRIIEHAGLSAVVGSVDPQRFGGEPPRGDLEELRSLEAVLRAHHRVVDIVAGVAAVVPLRLGTVCRSDGRVRELLSSRRAGFETALSRVTGRTEWGVKVVVDPEVFAAGPSTREVPPDDVSPAGPGTRYLRRRHAEERSRRRTWDRAAAFAEEVHAAMSSVAVTSRRHTPQDARLSGHHGWMLLNGAYLVDHGRYDDLTAVAHRFHDPDRGVQLELTGPWAPYSFAEGEEA
jgi:Gas vesicle synthesis protein GvpL/GvpF